MRGTTVIAITGSVGKSTAKECLGAILATEGPVLITHANQNDDKGVSRALRRLRPWHRFAVLEIGAEKKGDITRLAALVRPDVAVVLSVASTHTNEFATLEETAAEKSEILRHLSPRGRAVLNGDDDRVRAMASMCIGEVLLFGQTAGCDVVARDVSAAWPERLRFSVDVEGTSVTVQTRLVGRHWLGSALGAMAAAVACGVPARAAAAALSRVEPFTARMQPVKLPSGAVLVRDECSGSIDSVNAMIEVLRSANASRRILVFGDMTDVRGNAKKRQRRIGKIAAQYCDMAIFVDEHGHHALRAAIDTGMDPEKCHHVVSLERAAAILGKETGEGDLVFLKSRGTDHLSRIAFAQFGPIGCSTRSCRIRSACDLCAKLRPEFDLAKALANPPAGAVETSG